MNLFNIFLEAGSKITAENGILSFVIPEGFYSNIEYRFSRNYLLTHARLLFLCLFHYRVFDAAVDTTIVGLRQESIKSDYFIPVYFNIDDVDHVIKKSHISLMPYDMIPIKLDSPRIELHKKLTESRDIIGNHLEIQQGIIYSGQARHEVFADIPKNKYYKKVLDGRDIGRFSIHYDKKERNKYILYTDKLHRPRDERLFLSKAKILIVRKATRLICTIDTEQYYVLNTAYVCLPKKLEYSLTLLLGILNSNVVNYFYRSLWFGWQVTIPAIEFIPLPPKNEKTTRLIPKIEDIVNVLLNKYSLKKHNEPSEKIRKLEESFNSIIYDIYNLNNEEIKIIEESV